MIIIHAHFLGTRIRTRAHARGIYTRGKRERGSVTRARAHARATTVPGVSLRWENLGVRHIAQNFGSIHRAGRIKTGAAVHGAGCVVFVGLVSLLEGWITIFWVWYIVPAAVVVLD